jgi:glycosyltransferase involved in cell wall biosynthesis
MELPANESGTRPEVSVIISVLNGELYIGHISDYVRRQTFKDIEVIFVISSKCVDASLAKAREAAS